MSRAWSLGQLGDPDLGDWGLYFDPHASHSDPLNFYSTQPLAATSSMEVSFCSSYLDLHALF